MILHLLEQCTDSMVLKEEGYDIDVYVWGGLLDNVYYQEIRYKLRIMGVPISGSSYIYGDIMSFIKDNQRPESTLIKKSNSICYHDVRKSVAVGNYLT